MKANRRILIVLNRVQYFTYFKSMIKDLRKFGYSFDLISFGVNDDNFPEIKEGLNNLPYVEVIPGKTRKKSYVSSLIYNLRILHGVALYFTRPNQSEFYKERWIGHLASILRPWALWPLKLLRTPTQINSFFRNLESKVPVCTSIEKHLKELRPDCLFLTPANMQTTFEVEYLKAAKKLGIPCYVGIVSWDNLTTKGAFPITANKFFLWNKDQHQEAIKVHGLSPDTLEIVGASFFDKWKSPAKSLTNGHQKDDYIVYLGSSASVSPNDRELIQSLRSGLDLIAQKRGRPLKLIVRPHPSNYHQYEGLEGPDLLVFPKRGSLPEGEAAETDFYNTLKDSLIAVSINTSAILDSIILGQDCICLIKKDRNDVQSQALHFRTLMKYGVTFNANSLQEVLTLVEEKMDGTLPNKKQERENFINDYIWPSKNHTMAGPLVSHHIRSEIQPQD